MKNFQKTSFLSLFISNSSTAGNIQHRLCVQKPAARMFPNPKSMREIPVRVDSTKLYWMLLLYQLQAHSGKRPVHGHKVHTTDYLRGKKPLSGDFPGTVLLCNSDGYENLYKNTKWIPVIQIFSQHEPRLLPSAAVYIPGAVDHGWQRVSFYVRVSENIWESVLLYKSNL